MESTRARAYRQEEDRCRFLVGRGMLRVLLGGYLGRPTKDVPIVSGAMGKPVLPPATNPGEWQFNVAHSGKWILAAIARRRRVGVDVERIRPMLDLEPLAERCCSPRERQIFKALPEDEKQTAFFRCWTRKEAYMKGLGLGLEIPLDALEVSFTPGETARLVRSWQGDTSQYPWCLRELDIGSDYAAAMAVEGDPDRLSCWDWPASFWLGDKE